jgi:hypothetical protein
MNAFEKLRAYVLEIESTADLLATKAREKEDADGRASLASTLTLTYAELRRRLSEAATREALKALDLPATSWTLGLLRDVEPLVFNAKWFLVEADPIRRPVDFAAWGRAIDQLRVRVQELRNLSCFAANAAEPVETQSRLALAPGGFSLGDKLYRLTGRPLEMLRVLLNSKHYAATVTQLRIEMKINDEVVSFPEQVIRDAAKALRAALRRAANKPKTWEPVPSAGTGEQISYRLDLEKISSE